MLQQYNVFNSAEFTDRDLEFKRVNTILKKKSRDVLIFEGERGSGKTTFLFELYRRLQEQRELRPFLISLFPHSISELEPNKNIWLNTWLNSERQFQKDDIPDLLNRLAHYLEIDVIETDDREFQKDYFARGLAYRASKTIPILLVDSIYECPEDIRVEIEKYILAPILASERVFLILSGRGKRPIWSRPELQMGEIIELPPLEKVFVKEQLIKMGSVRVDESDQIVELSGGYPLIVRVLGKSDKSLPDALNDAIDDLITETLPESEREGQRYLDTRSKIEKLSLVGIPFRIPDIEEYLYPDNPERRAETNNLINILLTSHILRYEGKGYQLNKSISHPIQKWLTLQERGSAYIRQLQNISVKLQKEYPSAKAWYQRMVPPNQIIAQH